MGKFQRGLNSLNAVAGNYGQATAFATTEINDAVNEVKQMLAEHFVYQDQIAQAQLDELVRIRQALEAH